MKRKISIAINFCLLLWFFLDMIGATINTHILVTRSYKDDGIFFFIFLVLFALFVLRDKAWSYILASWLFIWFLAQFLSHWHFTIFGPAIGKMNYFANTIKLIPSSDIYIPDLYHIILHILILASLISVVSHCITSRKLKPTR